MTRYFLLFLFFVFTLKAEPLFEAYHDNKELDQFINSLNSQYLKKEILGKTLGANTIHCLKFSSGKETKPAILILGDTNPASPAGTEIILQWLKKSVQNKAELEALLESCSLYIIPRPFPDALDSFFNKPYRENQLNKTPVDSDSDLELNEDGFEDLNGDGFISVIRIKDDNGTFFEHKDSPLLMTKTKNDKSASYRLISEGIDNDKDEAFNEDPAGGVNPNKNFSFSYPYFQKDSGIHQFSETESKAIADFAFKHPEIFLVFSFSSEDNLVKPWKEDPQKKKASIRSTVYQEDEVFFELYSSKFKSAFDIKKLNHSKNTANGSLAHWAYYHFGRISLTTTPWEIPADEIKGEQAAEIKELEWLKKNRPQALSQWSRIKHPDFPGKICEVGGIKPFFSFVPDIDVCTQKAEKFNSFIQSIKDCRPKLLVTEFKTEKLSDSLSRLTLKIKNEGTLPFRSKIGEESRKIHPLNISLDLPKTWSLYNGHIKTQIGNLKVKEEKEISWLIITDGIDRHVKARFSSPQIIDFHAVTGEKK